MVGYLLCCRPGRSRCYRGFSIGPLCGMVSLWAMGLSICFALCSAGQFTMIDISLTEPEVAPSPCSPLVHLAPIPIRFHLQGELTLKTQSPFRPAGQPGLEPDVLTASPSSRPATDEPTANPSFVPTRSPSRSPTALPTAVPTIEPTGTPSTEDNRCMGVLCSGHGTCTDPKVGNCVCDPGWFTPAAKLFLLSAHCSEVPVKVVAQGTAQGCQSSRSLGISSSTRLEGTEMHLEGSQTLACEANRTNWTSRSFVIIVRSSCRVLHAVPCVLLLHVVSHKLDATFRYYCALVLSFSARDRCAHA